MTANCLHCGRKVERENNVWHHEDVIWDADHAPCPYKMNPANWR